MNLITNTLNNKKIYCLHDDIKNIDDNISSDDILTFDDGCYSVYKYKDILTRFNNIILFICPSYINMEHRIEEPNLDVYYQYDYRINGNKNRFLTIYELEELLKMPNVTLGMHSYFHDIVYIKGVNDANRIWRMYKLSTDTNKMKIYNHMYAVRSKLATKGIDVLNNTPFNRNNDQYTEFIKSDTYMCVEWFKKYFGDIKDYAYPFFETSKELDAELKHYNIKNAWGKRLHI